jgi:hypothetical protein
VPAQSSLPVVTGRAVRGPTATAGLTTVVGGSGNGTGFAGKPARVRLTAESMYEANAAA